MTRKLFALIFAVMLALPSAHAQDSQRSVAVFDDFSGGLVSKVSGRKLKPTQAAIAENVRFDTNYPSLTKRDNLLTYGTADATEPITGLFRHYEKDGDKVLVVTHGDELEVGNDSTGAFTTIFNLTTGDQYWQFVTWHDILIGTDGYNQPIKFDLDNDSATYLGALLAVVSDSGSGPASGAYTYKVACYSTTYTVLLDQASNQITADGNDVTLSMIPICPDTLLNGESTIGRKIYRTESDGSTYKLLSNGTVNDNTSVTLTDSDADGVLGGAMPAGDQTWTPPKGRFLLVMNNRLFLANDPTDAPSRVYYSQDGSHEMFTPTSYLDVRQDDGDTITFIENLLGIIVIGKNNSIQKLYIDGDDPDEDWKLSEPLTETGCQAPYSLDLSPYGLIYLAKDGIYRFAGGKPELISESVSPEIEDIPATSLNKVYGIYHDNKYYLSYASEATGENANNRVLVLDLLAKAYEIDLLSISAFTAFNSGNDWGILYGGASDTGAVYAFRQGIPEMIHKRHSDFAGLWDDMRYIPDSDVLGGDSEDPVIEISRTETIDELTGTIDAQIGTINREDTVGYYVSQPVTVTANGFDLLYWNESIPVEGGSVQFKLRTSDTGESNLLLNDDFEFWENYLTLTPSTSQPNDWAYTQGGTGGTAVEETTEVNRGSSSAKVTKSSSGDSEIATTIANPTSYQGQSITFAGYVKSANSAADQVQLEIDDGVGQTTTSYANGGGWEHVSVTRVIDGAATSITVKCNVKSSADAAAYFDQVMARQASSVTNDWSAWSSAFTDSSGSDISAIAAADYIQYQIRMETDDISVTPTIVKVGFNIKLTYSKEGTSADTDIPLHWQSGLLDFGAPGMTKELRKIEAYHQGTTGDYTITITDRSGNESDTWTVDMATYDGYYAEYPTNGVLLGEDFIIDIQNDGVESFTLDKLVITYDIAPNP